MKIDLIALSKKRMEKIKKQLTYPISEKQRNHKIKMLAKEQLFYNYLIDENIAKISMQFKGDKNVRM
jgi:uncharacterized membrane protein